MNQNAQRVIYRFKSDANQQFLRASLSDIPAANWGSLVTHFVQRMSNDLVTSDPIMGVAEQVDCYNKMFIRDTRRNSAPQDSVDIYSIRDGDITTRNTAHSRTSANEVLQLWQKNPYRGISARDDTQQMVRPMNPVDVQNGQIQKNNSSEFARFEATGITFCDQSGVGTSSHMDRFLDNSYIQALNRTTSSDQHTNFAFGDANVSTDARLMQRRIFRDGGDGENTIPNYERRLYRRHVDRHIDEDLANTQYEYQQRGHNMQPLRDRIDHIKNYKEQIDSKYAPQKDTYYSRDEW